MKFKIGDRVEITKNGPDVHIGLQGTVTNLTDEYDYVEVLLDDYIEYYPGHTTRNYAISHQALKKIEKDHSISLEITTRFELMDIE